MLNHHSISITVSDEESDDQSRLLRALRKRRKQQSLSFRSKTKSEFLLRVLRKVLRWWALILFVPAIGLLLLEVSRVLVKDQGPDLDLAAKSVSSFGRKGSVGNLDRSEPRTRVVHGVRERKFGPMWWLLSIFEN
jgi:hypothetical protein